MEVDGLEVYTTCGSCRWWFLAGGDGGDRPFGFCHIDPPQLVWCEGDKRPRTFWPSTLADTPACSCWEENQ